MVERRVLIAGIGGDFVSAEAIDSFYNLKKSPEDAKELHLATRGEESREAAIQKCLDGGYQAVLLCDLDMMLPPETLERLWDTGKDVVSGLYYRRQIPAAPVAFKAGDVWPLEPLFDTPDTGLIEIGATGFGCLLVRRRVLDKMRELLRPGEPYISNRDLVEATGDYGTVGGDLRFCYRCWKIGTPVYMLCDLLCGHLALFPVGRELFEWQGGELPYRHIWERFARERVEVSQNLGRSGMDKGYVESRVRWHQGEVKVLFERAKKLRDELVNTQKLLTQREGAMKELQQQLEDLGKEELAKGKVEVQLE